LSKPNSATAVFSTPEGTGTTTTATPEPSSKVTVFGWTPDASKPCYGLPGAIEPLGFFDPLEFTKDADLNTVKRLRYVWCWCHNMPSMRPVKRSTSYSHFVPALFSLSFTEKPKSCTHVSP
jgi:hypothetical protein